MHESTLAKRLLDAALEIAREQGARRVHSVHGWIAESEPLNRNSIEAHFVASARGTLADGARLELEIDHVGARCAECGATYLPTGHLTLCLRCGSPDAELTGRTGAGIRSIEVED
jgi:hydrogenase nickel incorporation protein HypA/HybF